MKSQKPDVIIILAVAAVLVLFTAVGAHAYTPCSGYEIANGTCTEMLKPDGTPFGYVVRLADGYPNYDSSTNTTTFKYDAQKDSANYPDAGISHAILEFIICRDTFCTPTAATVSGSPAHYELITDAGGANPTEFLKWFPRIVKIESFPDEYSGPFSITVSGLAQGAIGNLGFKYSTDILATGKLLMPVANKLCGVQTPAATKEIIIATKDGYKFYLTCNVSTGCCEVYQIETPEGNLKDPIKVTIEQFMSSEKENPDGTTTTYEVQEMSVAGQPCTGIVLDDESIESPSYCSGGWCYY